MTNNPQGGQIVPSSTEPEEVCVNGMSFSRRDSQWANSALVVTVAPDDKILESYKIPSTVRVRRGIDIDAGCGQLKSTRQNKERTIQ